MMHKGYHGVVKFDESADVFHGRIVGIRDAVNFEGRDVGELRKAFVDSVEDYLDFCRELKREPDKPYSENLVVRMPEELHRNLDVVCSSTATSMNQFVVEILEDALAKYRIRGGLLVVDEADEFAS